MQVSQLRVSFRYAFIGSSLRLAFTVRLGRWQSAPVMHSSAANESACHSVYSSAVICSFTKKKVRKMAGHQRGGDTATICSIILRNGSSPGASLRRHMYSSRCDSIVDLAVPQRLLCCRLRSAQSDSTVWVCAPVTGLTK